MKRPVQRDRPMVIFVRLLAIGLAVSVAVPFVVVTVRERSVLSGLGWFFGGSGVVPALIGCALISPALRRWRTVRRVHEGTNLPRAGTDDDGPER